MSTRTDGDGKPTALADRVRSLQLSNPALDRPIKRGGKFAWFLCIVFAGTCGYLAYQLYFTKRAPVEENTDALPEPPVFSQGLQKSPSEPEPTKPAEIVLEAGGYILPVRQVQVSPKVGGQVLELFIEEGQYVEKDAVLAKLDRTEYEFDYQRMAALVEQAKARYEELKNGSRLEEIARAAAALKEGEEREREARDNYRRVRNSGLASTQDELEKAASAHVQAEHFVEQLSQELKMLEDGPRPERIAAAKAEHDNAVAQRDKAKYFLDHCTVKAPVSGVILTKEAEVGNTVRPEAFSNGLSASLCEMADLKDLEVEVDVGERDLSRVYKGQKCKIRTDAYPEVTYEGEITRLMPVANRSKRSVAVRIGIEVPADDNRLRPEMQARVQFLADPKPEQQVTIDK